MVVVEGEFDALSLQVKFLQEKESTTSVIGSSGGALKLEPLNYLDIETVYLYADNDEGGINWVSKALKSRGELS